MKRKKPKPPVSRLVIDEAVPREAVDRFRKFAKGKSCWSDEHLRIKDRHPGMPDGEILHHLLDEMRDRWLSRKAEDTEPEHE